MCTEKGYHEDLIEHSVPQALQGDMLRECLTIMKLGHDPISFDYIIPPAPETIVRALGLLRQLRAVDADGRISQRGQDIAAIPTDVYFALSLLECPKFGCSDEVITTLAMVDATKGGSYLFRRAQSDQDHDKLRKIKRFFKHTSGDHLTLFNIYMAWREACYTKKRREFLRGHMLIGGALISADHLRLHYLESMNKIEFWEHCELSKDDPSYYTRILQALAADTICTQPNESLHPKSFSSFEAA
jgi:pre-mRNA-splicing factor ATP-dependent RNA helicase DHX15/PRP43